MSVLRDAMELGYGVDHFMVTGEDFPKDWEDPVKKRRHHQFGLNPSYKKPSRVEKLNLLKSQGVIDTKQGWLIRNKIVCDSEKIYCFIDNVQYYNEYQTSLLSEVIDKKQSDIENQIDGFFNYIKASDISEEKELDCLFEGLESQILTELNEIRMVLHKKRIAMSQKDFWDF